MHLHVHSNPEFFTTPLHPCSTVDRPEPDGKGQRLPAKPRKEPLSERASLSILGRSRKSRCVIIGLNRSTRVQQEVERPVDRTPDRDTAKPEYRKTRPGRRDANTRLEKGQSGNSEGTIQGAEEAFSARLYKRRKGYCVFAHAQPAYSSTPILGDTHVGHGLNSQVTEATCVLAPALALFLLLDLLSPQKITNQMVFADVLAEEVDSSTIGEAVKVSTPEHGAFSDNAGSDQNSIDRRVEFGVSRGEEELLKPTATNGRRCALSLMS